MPPDPAASGKFAFDGLDRVLHDKPLSGKIGFTDSRFGFLCGSGGLRFCLGGCLGNGGCLRHAIVVEAKFNVVNRDFNQVFVGHGASP